MAVTLQDANGVLWQVTVDINGQLSTNQVSTAPSGNPNISTYTPQQAVDFVQSMVHGVPISDVAPRVCDQINSIIWVFYPWGWTIENLTPITLVDGQQDYTPTDTDMLRPLRLRVARTDITPKEYRELEIMADLGVELTRKGGLDTIQSVGWFASQNFFRFDICPGLSAPTVLQLQGEYQKVPHKITSANMSTVVLPVPDHYFNVFCEGVLWKLYALADDPRAGTVQMVKNGTLQYTGQLGVFRDALVDMARTEDLGNGDQRQFPDAPLGIGRSYWPGIFGL